MDSLKLKSKDERTYAVIKADEGFFDFSGNITDTLRELSKGLREQEVIVCTFDNSALGPQSKEIVEYFGDTPITLQFFIGQDNCQLYITHQRTYAGPKLKIDRIDGKPVIKALNHDGLDLLLRMHGNGARAMFKIVQLADGTVQSESEATPNTLPDDKYDVIYDRDVEGEPTLATTNTATVCRTTLIELLQDPRNKNVRISCVVDAMQEDACAGGYR